MPATRRRGTTPTGSGYLYEAAHAFHIRYYTQVVGDGGEMSRVQKSKLLCKKDAKHPNITCKAVRDLRQTFMTKINGEKPSAGDMPINLFWDRFIAYLEEVRKDGLARRRNSTIYGYKKVYKRRLEKHFGKLRLSEYEPEMGTRYLDSLSATLGKKSLEHIKAVANSMFERAVTEGHIKVNPWRGVKIPEDALIYETEWYTQQEAAAIIEVLKDQHAAQLAFTLGCYCGLRPGEIQGLKWEDFDRDAGKINIRRAVVRSIEGLPKTKSSIAPVFVPLQVCPFIDASWEAQGKPTAGCVFPNKFGSRWVELNALANFAVKPALKAAGLKWKGWQACRRSCVTWIIENTKGNAALAQAQARHKSMATTLNIYKKAISVEAHRDGILEAFPMLTA